MEQFRINHIRHGRALLAMRLPDVRRYLGRAHLDEICESYSIVSLRIAELSKRGAPASEIEEYRDLRLSIEMEASYYAVQAGKRAG